MTPMTSFAASDADTRYSPLSRHLAEFITRLNGAYSLELYLAAFLVTEATLNGHICLNLHAFEKQVFHIDGLPPLPSPPADAWSEMLKGSPVVGTPGEFKPLILDDADRLYTYRYWHYEKSVAERIIEMAGRCYPLLASIRPETCIDLLIRLFPEAIREKGQPSGQVIAALIALTRDFCLISGSPGTGKTTAVARILAFILDLTDGTDVRIALSAPTAKAAIRLQEAISRAKETLPCEEHIKNRIPERAVTIHRLLKSSADGVRYHHNQSNPLPYDIVVVDEASMIDLPLMYHLLEAMPFAAKLILLGDPHQLSSVEAGAVLGDICRTGDTHLFSPELVALIRAYTGCEITMSAAMTAQPLRDCLVELKTNYRVDEDSPLGQLKQAVIKGHSGAIFELLESGVENIRWIEATDDAALKKMMETEIGPYLNQYMKMISDHFDIKEIFSFFDTYRLLCAVRSGLCGTTHLNRLMEKFLKDLSGNIRTEGINYPGKAVMISRNDYARQLFNGDLGLMLPESGTKGRLSVFFREGATKLRQMSPYVLPEHETAFAMTVHKSQGSEYDRVFLFLPDADSPVLNRELLYTGITRARRALTVYGRKEILAAALSRKVSRYSALTEKIWKHQDP